MARCDLQISNEKFQASLGEEPDLRAGLERLRDTVAKDHRLSGFVLQPMQGYKDLQNKIWKWDLSPVGERSATRKGWRLYAYVPDPKAREPIPAIPFFFYPKDKEPGGNYPKHVSKALKAFLSARIKVEAEEERFKRQYHSDGRKISLCLVCFEPVAISTDPEEIAVFENTHECPGPPK